MLQGVSANDIQDMDYRATGKVLSQLCRCEYEPAASHVSGRSIAARGSCASTWISRVWVGMSTRGLLMHVAQPCGLCCVTCHRRHRCTPQHGEPWIKRVGPRGNSAIYWSNCGCRGGLYRKLSSRNGSAGEQNEHVNTHCSRRMV